MKKRLLTAMKLYNTGKYKKAEKILKSLYEDSNSYEERRVSGLFLALNYTDWGYTDKAIEVYERLIGYRIESDTIFNNLAKLYNDSGNTEKAMKYYEEAIRLNPDCSIPYSNIAHIYFDNEDLEKAKEYAITALEKNDSQYQASNLLAIIYCIEGDKENSDKYFRMSLKNGVRKDSLRVAIEQYKKIYSDD